MKTFTYDITLHPVDSFKKVAFFCTQAGECSIDEVPSDHIAQFQDILNARGQMGWELSDVVFGKDGLMVFWKREVTA